jgi:hypothetical protein
VHRDRPAEGVADLNLPWRHHCNGLVIGASANPTVAGVTNATASKFSFLTSTKHAFGLI